MRVQKSDIPYSPMVCRMLECVYNVDSVCSDPRTHNGNSDAMCFSMSNKYVLGLLTPINGDSE